MAAHIGRKFSLQCHQEDSLAAMDLAAAITVFITERYLKLYAPLVLLSTLVKCKSYNELLDSRPSANQHLTDHQLDYLLDQYAHIVVLELILTLVMIGITFASLCLSKMDCQRISNYFLVPVYLAVAYLTLSKRVHSNDPKSKPSFSTTIASDDESKAKDYLMFIESAEAALSNGLGLLATAQLATNLLGAWQFRSVNLSRLSSREHT